MPVENVKHGKYVVELKPGHSIFKQVTAPQIGAFGTKDLNGASFSLGWSLLTEPFLMVAEAHKHDFDQYIFFMGGDPGKVDEFDAEIEFGVDNKMNVITYPACIRIPAGTMHGPLNVKKVNKPCMFIDIVMNTGPSVRPVPPDTKTKK
ncbi:MAG: hypothetical protein ABR886_03895 [Dehalococcoidales bacterium]|jgi:hypothetical protein